MYLEHFGLTVSPFGISPRLEFLYRSGAFEESMAHLIYGLDNSEAIVMITGAIGTGKTMAIQSFLSRLGDAYATALVTNTSVDGKELLKLILEDLGSPAEAGADKSDLLIAFKKLMLNARAHGQRVVIVIDEAQHLAREVLEEIRQLTNLGQGEDQPVQVILVGQPELEAAVLRPELAQLKQRIRVHYKLDPLSRREFEEYVDHRMAVAGGKSGTFVAGALDRIYELSGGIPRVVNTLCGDALLSAFVAGRERVEARDVGERDLTAAVPTPEMPAAGTTPPSAALQSVPMPPPAQAPTPKGHMAVRREVEAPPPRTVRNRAHRRTGKRKPAGAWGAVVALVALAAVLVAMMASGRLAPFWSRLKPEGPSQMTAEAPTAGPANIPSMDTAEGPVVELEAAPVDSLPDAIPRAVLGAAENTRADVVPELDQGAAAVAAASETPAPVPATAATNIQQSSTAGAEVPVAEYFIHVSSFRTAEHAGAVASKFSGQGIAAKVREQTVRGDLWYRVYLGPFPSHDEAARVAARLREEGAITYSKIVRPGAGGES